MKIRTDFVTNSSSSSFVLQIELQLSDGQTLKFKTRSDDDSRINDIYMRVSPKELGSASSVDELIKLLQEGATTYYGVNDDWEADDEEDNADDADEACEDGEPRVEDDAREDDEPSEEDDACEDDEPYEYDDVYEDDEADDAYYDDDEQGEIIFKDDSSVPEIRRFMKKLRKLTSMDQIEQIHIVGTEYMGNENDRLDLTYDRKTGKYTGKRYGSPITENPNGACGGNYRVDDIPDSAIMEVLTLDGRVICEYCGSYAAPESAVFATDDGCLHRFCKKQCAERFFESYCLDEPSEILSYADACKKYGTT